MIARILAVIVVVYLVLVSAGVAIVWLLSPKIGFLGGLAAAAAVFALIAWGIIRVVAQRLKWENVVVPQQGQTIEMN